MFVSSRTLVSVVRCVKGMKRVAEVVTVSRTVRVVPMRVAYAVRVVRVVENLVETAVRVVKTLMVRVRSTERVAAGSC